jgi:anti-repressor protein
VKELITVSDYSRPFPVNARDLYEALDIGRDFSTWIKAQIEKAGFIEQSDFEKRSPDLGSGFNGGQNRIDYFLSLRMAKNIAMVTQTDSGKRIREHFIAVETAWNTPEMVMLRGLQAAQEVIQRQSAQIASLADDARVARTIADARGLKTITEVAKINNVGPRKIFDLLAERKIIYRIRGDWVPMQDYIERGYFVVKERTYAGTSGAAHLSTQIYVTGKGEVWLVKQFFPAGAVVA